MIKVKLSIPGIGRNVDLSQFTGNRDGRHEDIQFLPNCSLERADAWVVMEGAEPWDRRCRVPNGRLIFVAAEAARPVGFIAETPGVRSFLNQFDHVYTFLDHDDPVFNYAPPFLPWMVNANHGPSVYSPHHRDINFFRHLKDTRKSRLLSVFCSIQGLTREHRMRLRFVKALSQHFGRHIEWYGNGVNQVAEKWDGLAPFRYTVVLENQSTRRVVTEKIQDAYLALSFPIYWGAPDISDYFPKDSLRQIDIRGVKTAIESVEKVLDEDPYQERVEALLKAKSIVTEEFNVVSRLSNVVRRSIEKFPDDSQSREVHLLTARQLSATSPSAAVSRILSRMSTSAQAASARLSRWGG